ncbi:MAG: VWA domain-containing protein, partial [Myxococcota bacterium]
VAIVTYGSDVRTALALTSGADQTTISAGIAALGEGGSTNMEAGMQRAYDLARDAAGQTDQVRVVLFTDVQPNVGATSASEFEQIAANGADDGIGLTVMGLGLGLGQEVLLGMSHLRGGNAFSFSRQAHVDAFVEENWPWFASPIAHDLSLIAEADQALTVGEAYGIPADADGNVSLDVATVFLSQRKGALLLRLDDATGEALPSGFAAALRLDYRELSGEAVSEVFDLGYGGEPVDDRGHYYEQASVGKAVALAILVEGMHEAAELYGSDSAAAIERMSAVHARAVADSDSLTDPALATEVALAAELLTLMEAGAPQGDLYGSF